MEQLSLVSGKDRIAGGRKRETLISEETDGVNLLLIKAQVIDTGSKLNSTLMTYDISSDRNLN